MQIQDSNINVFSARQIEGTHEEDGLILPAQLSHCPPSIVTQGKRWETEEQMCALTVLNIQSLEEEEKIKFVVSYKKEARD